MKNLIMAAVAAALALGALTGCSPAQPTANEVDEYIGVCMDNATQNRVPDANCNPNIASTRYMPYFYSYGSAIPALGFHVVGGYKTIYAPYNMGFGTRGGSSANYKPRTPLTYPKGYVSPPNAVLKKSSPSITPPKTASEAAAKYAAPKAKSSTKSGVKSNPYSYKGKTSFKSSSHK